MAPLARQLLARCDDGSCWSHVTTTTLFLPLPPLAGALPGYVPLEAQTKTITLTYSQSGPSVVLVTEPGPTETAATLPPGGLGGADVITVVSTLGSGTLPTGMPDLHSQSVPTPTAAPTNPLSTVGQGIIPAATAAPTDAQAFAQRPINSTSSPTSTELKHTGGIMHPNGSQVATIWAAAVMFVSILVAWGMVVLRDLLYPWKLFINVIHEGSHIFVAMLSGAKIHSVSIDPDRGPISGMTKGIPLVTLSAGYLGSSVIGAALIMCGFDTRASKIAWLVTLPLWLPALWFGMTWARVRVVLAVALSIGFWFMNHAAPLRFYILFCGVMCTFFVLWDTIDDFVFRKQNESDAALFSRLSAPGPHGWTAIWLLVAIGFAALGILGGLHFFTLDSTSMREAQKSFLPT